MSYVFDELGYRRYQRKLDVLNQPSHNTEWLSITDAEWPQRKAAFEAWLDESNFTEDGLQARSLESFRGSTNPHP